MEIKTTNSFNVTNTSQTKQQNAQDSSVKFSDELKELDKTSKETPKEVNKSKDTENIQVEMTVNNELQQSDSAEIIDDKVLDSTEIPVNEKLIMNIDFETLENIGLKIDTPKLETTENLESIKDPVINTIADNLKNTKPQIENTKKDIELIPVTIQQDTQDKFIEPVQNNENKNSDENLTHNTTQNNENIDKAIDSLNTLVEEITLIDINQEEENSLKTIKNPANYDDKTEETEDKDKGNTLINNDFSIENKDILPQMTPNMNFSGDGQPFSSFMNNEETEKKVNQKLSRNEKDLAEEAAILSTMAENIEIAKNNITNQKETDITDKVKTVQNNSGILKIDTQSGITIETVVKYDNIIMNEADVEVFAQLVQNTEVNMNNLAPEAAEKAVNVSKTLADMLAKSMENNQPLRIDFDNNISVIIRVSRDGKLSAEFLPSSQVAEAYLKENLPLLKQRFDENNIQYDELSQRHSRDKERENNRRKDRNNE